MLRAGTRTRRPRLSVSARVPSSARAWLRAASTFSALSAVSTTSSREACRTPILTSMVLLRSVGIRPVAPRYGEGGAVGRSVLVGQRIAPDPAPGQGADQLDRLVLGDPAALRDPEPRTHLRHSHQRDRQQAG